MRTDTDVVITEYRAEFKAAPFCRPRWTVVGGMEYRTTLPRRRRWTVAREFLPKTPEPAALVPNTGIGHVHPSVLIDPDAVLVFVPNTPGSRFGHAVLIEQIVRQRLT